jgi:lipoate-protein ligase A
MKLIRLQSHDAYFNLATEEYLFQRLEQAGAYFLIWQNRAAVVVGSHQNTIEEVNLEFAHNQELQVGRRLSGGGAVYHDLGNLNYSVLVHSDEMRWDIKRMADPVINALTRLGVDVGINQRNDLLIDGEKISGSSQFIKGKRLLHHGTLLFSSDLSALSQSLKVGNDQIESRSIKSVRSKVTNISHHFPAVTIEKFIFALTVMLHMDSFYEEYSLSDKDLDAITQIKKEKYATWEWIFGRSPEFSVKKRRRLNQEDVEISFVVKNGIIQSLKFDCASWLNCYGGKIEQELTGVRISEEAIKAALNSAKCDQSSLAINPVELAKAIVY